MERKHRMIRELYARPTGLGAVKIVIGNGYYDVVGVDHEGGVYHTERFRNMVIAMKNADRFKEHEDARWRSYLWRMAQYKI